MKRLSRLLWWAGPWVGLAFFAWRQQGLEARLADWVQATNKAVESAIGRLTDVAVEASGEREQGRVRDGD